MNYQVTKRDGRLIAFQIDKIRKDMGYKPAISVAEGLSQMPRI